MSDFDPCPSKLFFSKNDPDDPRLGDLVQVQSENAELCILGYPDDEGIALNGGRLGAAAGPNEIRHWLYRTTPNARGRLRTFSDLGNLQRKDTLDGRHLAAQVQVASLLERGQRVLTLGGGNDYAYPDGAAFLAHFAKQDPLIINIDAHLDVRNLNHGPSSGTPFFRLLEGPHRFAFVEYGIQAQCNAKKHREYVEHKGGTIVTLDEILSSDLSPLSYSVKALDTIVSEGRPTFLAVDIDAFAWPYAAGSSAAWPVGLSPQSFWPFLQYLFQHLDLRVMGVYEVSPPLDTGGGTAKLAAQLAHGFLHHV